MTPSEYRQCYQPLKVPVIVDEKVQGWRDVRLEKYLLIVKNDPFTWDAQHPDNQAAHDGMLGKLMEHFKKKGATLTVHVKAVGGGVEHAEFDTWQEIWYYARKALLGKGCPEECQITLQLAERFGLLKGATVQDYCTKYLGLDCNGFVGNYLAHGYRKEEWLSPQPKGENYLANTTVGAIMNANGTAVNSFEELTPACTYILGLVGKSGKIIERYEGDSFAHIVITQPPMQWETSYTEGKTVRQVPTLMAVESTGGGVGLCERAALFLSVTKDGIFTVKRLSHPNAPPLRFRVYRVK
jgi:hypothetical protein